MKFLAAKKQAYKEISWLTQLVTSSFPTQSLTIPYLLENQVVVEGVNLNFRARHPCRKFCCQGSFPRNFPVVTRKASLPENSKQTAQQQCSWQQASQQEFFLRTKISVGKFSERFRTETSFQGIFPVGKLHCKSIVERQKSCAKACAWFLQNHSDSSGKKFSHETKFASQEKQKQTFTPQ